MPAPSSPPENLGRDECWRARLERLARNHPLFEHRASSLAVERARELPQPRVVSFGLGLCAPQSVSRGVPLDVLSMILCAELARRAVRAERNIVVIADAHALRSGLPRAEVLAQSARMHDVVRRVAHRCELPLSTVRASELHETDEHRQVHREVCRVAGSETPPYVSLETADTEALRRRHGSVLKLGWSLGGPEQSARDERFFDARYLTWVGNRAAFTYIKAGRTLSPTQPRMAPYVVSDPAWRPLLDPEDDARAKLERASTVLPRDRYRAAAKYYGQVVSAYAARTGPLRGSLADRIDALQRSLFAASCDEGSREAAE